MARRRYYYDSYEREFAAVVTGVREIVGRGAAVALEETAFYPASGGQPPDRGLLAGFPVTDVFEEEGEIWHLLQHAPRPGARVVGAIDWDRRFDHMQQHSGQHILSQAFLQVLNAQTISVHMERTCTMDLALPSLHAPGIERAVRLANSVVMENRPIVIREVSADEAVALGLRRPPKQAGLIRVVEVDAFDRSACGGTHVRATGEVGPVVVRGWERYKGGVRVEFLCGWRALRAYQEARSLLDEVTARLSTGDADLLAAVTRAQDRVREVERELDAARRQVLDHEADRLIAAADPLAASAASGTASRASGTAPAGVEVPSASGAFASRSSPGVPRIVAAAFSGRTIEEIRMLARALTARPLVLAALAVDPDRRLVVARSVDVGIDAAAVLRAVLTPFGGRGGGRAEVAEGAAGDAPSAQALVEIAAREVSRLLNPMNGRVP
jgi:alanyl-tRNA synthetase